MLISIAVWIFLFLFLVLIHEFWHFIAAKKSWVKVLEFWIWIPPRLFTFWRDKDWTEYTFNFLPFGWFVRLRWESPDNREEFLAKDSFITQSLSKKILILFWGVFMNLIVAIIFFWIAFRHWVKPMWIFPFGHSESVLMPSLDYAIENWRLSGNKKDFLPKVYYVATWYIASKIWIKSGDIILSINWQEVNFVNLKQTIQQNCWKKIDLKVQRWKQVLDLQAHLASWDNCKLWIASFANWDIDLKEVKFWFLEAGFMAFKEVKEETRMTFIALGNLTKKILSFNKNQLKEAVNQFSGPVGAVKIWEIILQEFWIWQYLAFAAMISLALAIFNVLPIPALDWGRALSVILQSVLRLDPIKYFTIESRLNIIFFVILMSFGLYVMWLDLQRFWGV